MEIEGTIQIRQNESDVVANLKFKHLSTQVRCQVLDLDGVYAKKAKKLGNSFKQDSENSILAEMQKEIDEVRNSPGFESQQEIDAEIEKLQIEYASMIDDDIIDRNVANRKREHALVEAKNLDILKKISTPVSSADSELINSPEDSDFWENANRGDIEKAVVFFREFYKF